MDQPRATGRPTLRRRLATAPWQVWSALGLVWWLAVAWPLLLTGRAWPLAGNLFAWGVVGIPLLRHVADRRIRRATGWDRRRRIEIVGAARHGTLPTDPADRDRLRWMVADDLGQTGWTPVVMPVLFAALAVLTVVWRRNVPLVAVALGAGWYLLLGGWLVWLGLRMRSQQRRVLAQLDAARVGGSTGG